MTKKKVAFFYFVFFIYFSSFLPVNAVAGMLRLVGGVSIAAALA
jgi:hypothetical protein